MAAATTKSTTDDHQLENKIYKGKKDKDHVSPENTTLWIQTTPNNPNPNPSTSATKMVPVIYFLSRDGHLDHPHFMEVPLSSIHGLYLSDFTNRLNLLRGKGFASLYSWSFKRSYKNSFVWHDMAAENELIHPSRGNEYILKGSELPDSTPRLPATSSFSSPKPISKVQTCSPEDSSAELLLTRVINDSVSDANEYRVYKSTTDTNDGESIRKPYSNASTQTDNRGTRRSRKVREQVEIEESQTTELTREDITPPPSDSSPETLGALIKANRGLMLGSDFESKDSSNTNRTGVDVPRGRQRATSFLMQLVSCGSLSFKTGGLTSEGFSLFAPYKSSVIRGAGNHRRRRPRGI